MSNTMQAATVKPLYMRISLTHLFLLAVVLRIAVWMISPNVAHDDENFQQLEQAGRLVFGRGMVPMEYQIGMRSWLIPGLIAPVMLALSRIFPGPDTMLSVLGVLMCVFSSLIVPAAWRIARPFSLQAAWWAAFINAVWIENIYFAPHFIPDREATTLMMLGLAFAVAQSALASFDMRQLLRRESGTLEGCRIANHDPNACGVGIEGYNWSRTGLLRLRRDMLLFQVPADPSAKDWAAYNYIISIRSKNAEKTYPPLGYHLLHCSSGNLVCVYKREGTCDPTAGHILRVENNPKAKKAAENLGYHVD